MPRRILIPIFPFLILKKNYQIHSKRISCDVEQLPPKLTETFAESYSNVARQIYKTEKEEEDKIDTDLNWRKQEPQSSFMCIEQINANKELEDRAFIVKLNTQYNGQLLFAAVIDGHGGWQIAEFVQRRLPYFLEKEIKNISILKGKLLNPEDFGNALKLAFNNLDKDMLDKIRGTYKIGISKSAKIGACCVSTLITDEFIITANAGDCRAIMYSENKINILSEPHSADNPDEQIKMKRQHPGEIDAIVCKKTFAIDRLPKYLYEHPLNWLGLLGQEIKEKSCYVKGRLQPTRSFGDFYLKFKEFAYDFENHTSFIRNGISFPYITVEPEIKIIKRDKNKNEFIMLGSDGIWDFLTPEESIDIIKHNITKSVRDAAGGIIQAVLKKAAADYGIDPVELTFFSPIQRRKIYDDTTTCIINLNYKNL